MSRKNKSPTHFKANNSVKKSTSSKSLTKSKVKSPKCLPKKKKNIYVQREEENPRFLEGLDHNSVKNQDKFKLGLLGYIFRERMVRDQQYNELY